MKIQRGDFAISDAEVAGAPALRIEVAGCVVQITPLIGRDRGGHDITSVRVMAKEGWALPDTVHSEGCNVRVRRNDRAGAAPRKGGDDGA